MINSDGQRLACPNEPAPLQVRVIDVGEGGQSGWDEYVAQHPRGTAFHTQAWKRVLQTLGGRPRYLMAMADGRPVGVPPAPARRAFSSAPPRNSEKGMGHRPRIARDVKERRCGKHLTKESQSRPAGQFDQQARPLPARHPIDLQETAAAALSRGAEPRVTPRVARRRIAAATRARVPIARSARSATAARACRARRSV